MKSMRFSEKKIGFTLHPFKNHTLIRSAFILMILLFLISPVTTEANTGWCSTVGGPHEFPVEYSKVVTDSSQNRPGTIVADYSWNLSGGYSVQCDCATRPETLFKAETLPMSKYVAHINGSQFFKINDALAVATKIFILNQGLVNVPFVDVSNNYNSANGCGVVTANALSGGQGNLLLYITKPLSGTITIPKTPIVKLYGTTIRGSYSTIPMAVVYLQGSITVPQSCTVNAGNVIQVNFDGIKASAISSLGATGAEKMININLSCSNISDGDQVVLSLTGTPDKNDSNMLATSNSDIGIKIKDSNANIISPNGTLFNPDFDFSAQQGDVTLYAAPVNTSGARPVSGIFNATATINIGIN